MFKRQIYAPKDKKLRTEIMRIHHDTPAAGHPGQHKTLELVTRNYWWPSMLQFVNRYVEACNNCLQLKLRLRNAYRALQPNERQWGTISMDFVIPLSKSKGFTRILVVVDRLMKMAHFIAVKKEITTLETAKTLMKNVFKLHRLPDKIISDRGPQFAAQVIQEMYRKLSIVPALSTAYHPQTDRQTKRVNQDLETYVRLFCMHRQGDWVNWLHLAEFSYNNREHSTIKMSLFRANNLSDPRWSLEAKTEDMTHPAVQEYLREMGEVETELKACLDMAAEKMKDLYNKGPVPEFLEGEMVFLDARNIKEKIQSKDKPTRLMVWKLRKKRIRPYRVIQKIGTLNYRLELSPKLLDKGVHDLFHVSLLTRVQYSTTHWPPPLTGHLHIPTQWDT